MVGSGTRDETSGFGILEQLRPPLHLQPGNGCLWVIEDQCHLARRRVSQVDAQVAVPLDVRVQPVLIDLATSTDPSGSG